MIDFAASSRSYQQLTGKELAGYHRKSVTSEVIFFSVKPYNVGHMI